MASLTDKDIEQIAQVCHEANRAFCATIGDTTQVSWAEAPDWQRASCIDGVKFRLLNPDAGPEASHMNWWKQKVDSGWTYGTVKDPEAKTHPCMVNFDQLPKDQQKKDHIFLGIVKALAW